MDWLKDAWRRRAAKSLAMTRHESTPVEQVPAYTVYAHTLNRCADALEKALGDARSKELSALERIAQSGPHGGAWCVAVALDALDDDDRDGR